MSRSEAFYHGTYAKIPLGGYVVPGAEIGRKNYSYGSDEGLRGDRSSRVWVTRNKDEAWAWGAFASGAVPEDVFPSNRPGRDWNWGQSVYKVEPEGEMQTGKDLDPTAADDMDDIAVERARVVGVSRMRVRNYRPRTPLNRRQFPQSA